MKRVEYVDEAGRKWITQLPDSKPDSDASLGIPVGPPSLERLDLPIDIEVRLHNALFERGIFTARDARRKRKELRAALRAALRVDAGRLMEVYLMTNEQV